MFKENDKALLTARVIFIVFICISAVSSLVIGILLAVYVNWLYFLFTFAGWFACWITWVFIRLYLSYLCDIKLIRNKLYNESNEGLEVFLNAKEEKSDSPALMPDEVEAELVRYHLLFLDGTITEEEYKKREAELKKSIKDEE